MNATTAEARLKRMCAWDKKPTLSQGDISELLTMHSRLDPSDESVTLYDLAGAAVEGWRWKMAAAASEITHTSDGQTIARDQYLKHCERMIEQYGAQTAYTISTSATDA